MVYAKFHDPWGSGTCCGVADPGPVTPITKGALNAHETGIFDAHTLFAPSATDEMQSSRVVGDAERRYQQLADGTINWGDGTNPTDTNLFRAGVGTLGTNSDFSINQAGLGISPEISLSADSGQSDSIHFRTGALDRWVIQKSNQVESGGQAGSDFMIQRFDDAGVFVNNPLSISRFNGVVFIANPGVASGAVVSTDGTQSLSNKTIVGFGAASTTVLMSHRVTGDTATRWNVDASGSMSWSPGAGAHDTFLKRSAPGVLQATDTSFQSQRSLAGLLAFQALVSGDTNPRWQVTAGGTISLGPGNAAVDFSFARVSNNVASVSGVLQYTGGSGTGGFSTFVTGDTVARIAMLNNGILFGPGNAVGDASLIRVSNGVLGTQGFQASGTVTAAGGFGSTRTAGLNAYVARVTGDTNDRFAVSVGGNIQLGPGNAVADWSLARSGAAQATITGALLINGNIGFYNTAPVAKPTVTGSRGGNAALASLLTALASQGLVTDSSTA